jgi:hypothetical protein
MEVKISPPMSIKMVKTMSWELEKTSISTVDILETVVADTDVKNRSKFLGLKESWVLGFKTFRTTKPKKETQRK